MEINKESLESLTPEQIVELAEKAQLADELKTKHDQSEATNARLVEELKEERTKKQLAEAAAAANAQAPTGVDEQKARDIVKAVLNEERSNQNETTRQTFEANFKASNPEFNTSNDPGGIKYDAFKRTLARFNVAGAKSPEELSEIYSDAMVILKKGKPTQSDVNNNLYAFGSTSKGSGSLAVQNDGDLSPREMKLIENAGWTKEKYLKLKVSQPDFVRNILDSVRD